LTNAKVPGDDGVSQSLLGGGIVKGQEGPGVAHGEAALEDIALQGGRELEKPQRVGDRCALFSDTLGDLLLGESKFGLEPLVGDGFLDAVEVATLQVLDEGQLEGIGRRRFSKNDRDVGQAGKLGGLPAALSGENLVSVGGIGSSYEDGLEDALFLNGAHEIFELRRLDGLSRLVGIRGKPVDGAVKELNVVALEPVAGGEQVLQSSAKGSFLVHGVNPFH
jgi:hypothetical protein